MTEVINHNRHDGTAPSLRSLAGTLSWDRFTLSPGIWRITGLMTGSLTPAATGMPVNINGMAGISILGGSGSPASLSDLPLAMQSSAWSSAAMSGLFTNIGRATRPRIPSLSDLPLAMQSSPWSPALMSGLTGTATTASQFAELTKALGTADAWDTVIDGKVVSFRQGCVRRTESGFLLSQEATDGGSADLKPACDLGFADSLPVQPSGVDGFVNHRRRAAEAFALLPGMS